ncbi:DUF2272 domain-containing protein [Ottowia thiooxydans]|uniref:DUF2272 domain-containing protein n=1 Tax=Ottowia thiooxydans TaxID=219182 RepID=UPI000409D13A|nr:DUF2272 domain-containing protein [Ottowia thiooxydans]
MHRHTTSLCHSATNRTLAVLCAAWLAAPAPSQAEQAACDREARADTSSLAHRLSSVALREHKLMGGALIDAGGGLIRQGFAEAEQDRAPESDRPTWQRVWNYWRSTRAGPPSAMAAHPSPAQLRAMLVDQPWSAVFIGHVMRQAGLDEREFRYSASHQDYVRAAFRSTETEERGDVTPYAYRACDLGVTAPRVGDLICFARDRDSREDTFHKLRQSLGARNVSMHCDLVVRRDSANIEAVGGNVVQSVTMRRLGLESDGSGRLWSAYFESEHTRRAREQAVSVAEGLAQAMLPDTYLNRKPWSVLLQLRGADSQLDSAGGKMRTAKLKLGALPPQE